MSSIDLIILGIVIEKPQSAYDIHKDVEFHHLSRWTKISIPSIYRKVLELCKDGLISGEVQKGDRFADKAIYSITEKGRAEFHKMMEQQALADITMAFDFNVVIANLNKLSKEEALNLIIKLREGIIRALQKNEQYALEYKDMPLTGKTIIEQQSMLYKSLLEWLTGFENQYIQTEY